MSMNHENERPILIHMSVEKLAEMLSTYTASEIETAYYFVIADAIKRQDITLEQAHNAVDLNIRVISGEASGKAEVIK